LSILKSPKIFDSPKKKLNIEKIIITARSSPRCEVSEQRITVVICPSIRDMESPNRMVTTAELSLREDKHKNLVEMLKQIKTRKFEYKATRKVTTD
jgi:hypothetical protein